MKNRLKELRHEKNLTLKEVSSQLEQNNFKISPDALAKYERGDREPRLETWEKLANFWEVSVPYLQGLDQDWKVSVPYLQWLDQEWYQAECLECGKVFRILSKEVDEINCCPFCKEIYLSISKVN